MSLVAHAKRELDLEGLFDRDADYGGMVGKAVLELVETFAKQGHSGFSAGMVLELFNKVASFKPLSKLSSDPEEWEDRSEISNAPMWQNMRDPRVFSKDGGETWYYV